MQFNFQSKITLDDFPPAGEAFSPKYVQNYGLMVAQLANGLQGGLTFAENMAAVWQTASITHNVGVSVYNPLQNKAAPKQVFVLPVSQPIANHSWTFTPSTNLISLTVTYALREQFMMVQATGAQTVANNTITSMTFAATAVESSGSNITYDGVSKMTFNEAGHYAMDFVLRWAASAVGTRQAWVQDNLSGVYGYSEIGPQGTWSIANNGSHIYTAAAGATMHLMGYNTAGGGGLATTSAPYTYWQIRQVSRSGVNDSPQLLIVGG